MDRNALAAYRRALIKRGRWVTFRRVSGNAPNTESFSATVRAVIEGYVPEKALFDIQPEGSITQGGRRILALQSDLEDKGFPLPVVKNDKVVIVDDIASPSPTALLDGEVLNVISVDPFKRAIAGALEILAVGV